MAFRQERGSQDPFERLVVSRPTNKTLAWLDRLSFRTFLGLELCEKTPDDTTLLKFRKGLAPVRTRLV